MKGSCVYARRASALALAAIVPGLAGCTNPFNEKIAGMYQVDPVVTAQPAKDPAGNIIAPTPRYLVDDGKKININDPEFGTLYNQALAGDAGKRNEIIHLFRRVSDNTCGEHLARISANSASYNFLLGTLTNLTAGLATFVGGGTTTQGLAAGAAFSSGTRSLVNEQFYSQQVGPIITRAIRENRDRLGNEIAQNMKSPPAQYSIDQALYELGRYHESCSFYVGIEQLNRAVTTQRKTKSELDAEIAAADTRIKALTTEVEALAASPNASKIQDVIDKRKETINALEEKRKTLAEQRSDAAQ